MSGETIIMAMSGGVDSSTAAALLKEQGKNIIGVTMRVWEHPNDVEARNGTCCTMDDVEDARRVAIRLGIPHYTVNVKKEFKEKVVDYFVAEYMRGRTPNPCVLCNQVIKFEYLFQFGAKVGATCIATGHYARIGEFKGHKAVMRGLDAAKDQSYFLFSIEPSRLASIMFPLGDFSKQETRRLAEKYELHTAQKSESQEICFVPDNDYANFIKKMPEGKAIGEGDIVDTSGKKLGRHKGFPFYTVGQRRGLGIGHSERLYVAAIDPQHNTVIAGTKEHLYGKALLAGGLNWYIPPAEFGDVEITARIRHQGKDSPVHVKILPDGRAEVEFDAPQLAITPGQAVVFYHGEVVLGGGWIERRLDI